MTDQERINRAMRQACAILSEYLEPGHVRNANATISQPIGLFKAADQSVQVSGSKRRRSQLPRSTYEKNGYKPDFDKLPTEDEYKAAEDNTRGPNSTATRPTD